MEMQNIKKELERNILETAMVKEELKRMMLDQPQTYRSSGQDDDAGTSYCPGFYKSSRSDPGFSTSTNLQDDQQQTYRSSGQEDDAGTSYGSGFYNRQEIVRRTEIMSPDEYYCFNLLKSMGQGVHIWNTDTVLVYWNHTAEKLYGYTYNEAIGKDAVELLVDPHDHRVARHIINQVMAGETWTGMFPLLHKNGHLVQVVATNTPIYDDYGELVGTICVSSDMRSFENETVPLCPKQVGFDATLWRTAASTSSSGPRMSTTEFAVVGVFKNRSGEDRPIAHISDYTDKGAVRPGLHQRVSKEVEKWMSKIGIQWPWKGKEKVGTKERMPHIVWPWVHNIKALNSSSSSSNVNTTSSISSCKSTYATSVVSDGGDFELNWEQLTILEQLEQGSSSTVYLAMWCGSHVAVEVFLNQGNTDELVASFKKEVCLMSSLRHQNILLFMGAITSPERLCVVTEFLARGSLQRVLQLSTTKLDWKRRFRIAVCIARGMSYLHNWRPPIVHCDLKSSNLFVSKDWVVKVGGFSHVRFKYDPYLTSNDDKSTPQWMAPEVLRDEPFDEKSDVFSYGVVLWELLTQKIPWDHLNQTEVINSVGYLGQRLEIPKDVDPEWVQIIESCWHSEPSTRPTFVELIEKLKQLFEYFGDRYSKASGKKSEPHLRKI